MEGVVLLSEIHPQGVTLMNPAAQAHHWFGLLTDADTNLGNFGFDQAIGLINQRANERGQRLVIRDWAHLDFIGVPFLESARNRFGIVDALCEKLPLHRAAIVRHPLDQWLSLRRLAHMQGLVDEESFLQAYRSFATQCEGLPYFRYEDFVVDPEKTMQQMCAELDLPYDPAFTKKWFNYETITGSKQSSRGGKQSIKPLPRLSVEPDVISRFRNNEDFAFIINQFEYSPSL